MSTCQEFPVAAHIIAPPVLASVAVEPLQFLKWQFVMQAPLASVVELSLSRSIPPPVALAPLMPRLAIYAPGALTVMSAVEPDPFLICGSPPCVLPPPTPTIESPSVAAGIMIVSA